MHENELSEAIIGAAIEVHKVLGGPGLLEDVYEQCLCRELSIRGLRFERQVKVPVVDISSVDGPEAWARDQLWR